MSNTSVTRIPSLPRPRRLWSNDRLARRLLLKVLDRIAVGELVIHDGPETFQLGRRDGGGPRAELRVHHPRAWRRVLTGGTIGSGEAYIDGDWSSPDLLRVTRVFCANLATMEAMESRKSILMRLALRAAHRINRNTRQGSRRNIAAHYDLGNDFFALFLDPTMMYSSALFSDRAATLEAASEAKLDEICRQLELTAGDHLLEIGTGWGGMALHAARHYGCRVTTTTISREQYQYTLERVRAAGLEERVEVLCEDYRALSGRYDKLVSIEMIEAVGHAFYRDYFRACSALLKPEGKMVIQAITMADQRYEQARDSVDFIKRYIFPGGCLPSLAVIADHLARDTDMQLVHLRDITDDYARTLACWRERFTAQLDAVKRMGFDQRFIRMWEFYLCYCEGGFRERIIGTVQLAMAKPGYRFGDSAPG
ncbi:SAM-dependent methyltransferase [Parahaliea mediterranea]|uniref:Class I SAM-dependent methyltransferase n=1 Tax=Parahaliea mediterranea TaxID=651086 RepID=A0A939IKS0_9GAMM|nr:cyclopropane-fatty-acyl-phospholipid synthase family protein [Parahaliea mediterranea]MBN7799064.1 class I SAM-dependent methyltransferase [Parahaliea mediterranea]